jgi:hypothetical protein
MIIGPSSRAEPGPDKSRTDLDDMRAVASVAEKLAKHTESAIWVAANLFAGRQWGWVISPHGLQVLGRCVGWQPEICGSPNRIPTSPGCGWFPTANPQTKRDYAVLDGTAGKMKESLLTSANAGKNGQRCFA